MLKAVKFGGSSLADAAQFQKCADIVKAESTRRYAVPSAPGKRNSADLSRFCSYLTDTKCINQSAQILLLAIFYGCQ